MSLVFACIAILVIRALGTLAARAIASSIEWTLWLLGGRR